MLLGGFSCFWKESGYLFLPVSSLCAKLSYKLQTVALLPLNKVVANPAKLLARLQRG